MAEKTKQTPQTESRFPLNVFGLPVERREIFSNDNHVYKKKIENRQRSLIVKVSFIKPFLEPDEKILQLTTGCSPVTRLEKIFLCWIYYYLRRCLFVFTTNRIFHIPTSLKYAYRNSVAQIRYADCKSIALKRKTLFAEYIKYGKKEKFLYIAYKERRKIRSLLKTISKKGKQSKVPERTHLCPRCTWELKKGRYTCPNCGLTFKGKTLTKLLSLFLPGGGYFYTRHPVLGGISAVIEVLILLVFGYLAFNTMKGIPNIQILQIAFGALIILEKTAVTAHCGTFVQEFIPKEKEFNTKWET